MSTAYTQNIGPQLFAVTIAFPGLSTLVIAVRIYICAFISRKFGLEDYLIIAAQITSLSSAGFLIPSITFGLGQPTAELSANVVTQALKWLFIATAIRVTALFLTKLSIVTFILYFRKTKNMPRTLFALVGLLSMGWIFSYVIIFAQCAPVKTNWEIFQKDNRREGKCWDAKLLFISQLIEDALNVLTSFMLLSLAALLVMRATLTPTSRLGVSLLLILGTCIAALSIQLTVLSATSPTNVNTLLTVPATVSLWSTIYLHLAIIIACFPSFRCFPLPNFIQIILYHHNGAAKEHKKAGRKPISTSEISHPRPVASPKFIPFFSPTFMPVSSTHLSPPPRPLHISPTSHTQDTGCSSTNKAKLSSKREALFVLTEDVDESVKTNIRKGGIGWREVSFRQSTQDFLLGLFPKPNQRETKGDRDSWD